MKKHEALSVGEIIQRAIENTGNRDQYERQMACYMWQEVVGPSINRLTIKRFVDRDVMHVYMASASLKNELIFQTPSLIEKINALVGSPIISKIIFH